MSDVVRYFLLITYYICLYVSMANTHSGFKIKNLESEPEPTLSTVSWAACWRIRNTPFSCD